MSRLHVVARVAAAGLTGALLTGCGSISLQGVPLPGGADLGDQPYTVIAQFRDVQDLVPQSSVKVNNVTVGQVRTVELNEQWNANAVLELAGDVRLPANVTAELKQTTLLGEKYVQLSPPTDAPPQGMLADGTVIPVERTNRFPEAEEVFGALSLLLNGGGIGQVQNIARELNTALDGREGDAKALLDDLNLLVSTLDGQRFNITRALDGVDKLSSRLSEQRENLDAVLVELEPGLKVLNEQRPQLVGMLEALDKLSDTATSVVEESQDDLVRDLELLRPTLKSLADSGDSLPRSLQLLLTPPFTDSAIKPTAGCCLNLNAQIDIDVGALFNVLLEQAQVTLMSPPALPVVPELLRTLPTAPLPDELPELAPDLLPSAPDSDESRLGDGLRKLPGLGGN